MKLAEGAEFREWHAVRRPGRARRVRVGVDLLRLRQCPVRLSFHGQ